MQTSYKAKYAALGLGLVSPNSVNEFITLMPAEVIPFGICVKRGSTGTNCNKIAVDGTTEKVVGVSVRRHNETGEYEIAEEATIMTKGAIAVEVLGTDTVKGGDNAYMIVASTNYGKFTKTAGSNTVACGVFQDAKDGNLAVIKFDIVA